ncbi:MAG: MMPL family transporter [Candidatus Dormibacteria bacterium]
MKHLRLLHPSRLAGLLDRRPGRVLAAAVLVCLVGSIGFKDFAVDSGQGLLVGSRSDAGQAYGRYSDTFGADPLVVVIRARNAPALYVERNLQRLQALEIALSLAPDVKSVLGPGTVAAAGKLSASQEVDKVLIEYPFFLAKLDVLLQEQKGQRDPTTLNQLFQSDQQKFTQLIGLTFLRAVSDAKQARLDASKQPTAAGARKLDAREQAVEQAVAKDPLPPGFDTYLASSSPNVKVNEAVARTTFDRLVASDGECNDRLAGLLQSTSNCQAFYERLLLDLPNCPTAAEHAFCAPKAQWATVLPKPVSTDAAYAVITVRMTKAAAGDPARVRALRDRIDAELRHGIGAGDLRRVGSSTREDQLKALGPLAPTECGDQPQANNQGCYTAFNNDHMDFTIAGAPLLALGITTAMTHLLLALLPVALLLMLLLLVGTFRARGRVWPLPAAVAAAALTIGGALWTRTSITPAVLAGVPVLVGLAVDYAVQLVARHAEARGDGLDSREAIRVTLSTAGPATGVAALATLAGLVALLLVAGVDLGPLTAVPLVAEFALVLAVGIVVSWLTAVLVALPAAVLADRRHGSAAPLPARRSVESAPPARRTVALAGRWRAVVAPSVALAVLGWLLLPTVPVETSAERLLAPNLAELRDVQDVRQAIGYANEVDIYVEGQVVGPYGGQRANDNVLWQCATAEAARRQHASQVSQATSIADLFFGTTTTSTGDRPSGRQCLGPARTGGGSSSAPAPSAGASATPTAAGASPPASGSPSARRPPSEVAQAGRLVPLTAASAADASPAPPAVTASPAGATSPGIASPGGAVAPPVTPTAGASPGGTGNSAAASGAPRQVGFLCSLRSFPQIARVLVQDIPANERACPPVDLFTGNVITPDAQPDGPIDPQSARIALGVGSTAIADQAGLVDALARDLQPPNGLRAQPAGLVVLAARAYDTLTGRALFLNLAPLLLVALALLAIHRSWRRALLPVLPTALAAGWAPLLLVVLGHLPGTRGTALSQLTPLTVVLGALVVALGTEFGVLVLGRFDEECDRGSSPEDAAAAALASTGRAVAVSALTLGGGFLVLALSGFLPGGLPLLSDFGLAVVVDLGLAVGAVFGVMVPVAVALERARPRRRLVPLSVGPRTRVAPSARDKSAPPAVVAPEAVAAPARSAPAVSGSPPAAAPPAPLGRRQRAAATAAAREAAAAGSGAAPAEQSPGGGQNPASPAGAAEAGSRRLPGMTGRRRPPVDPPAEAAPTAAEGPRRLPGLTGRRRVTHSATGAQIEGAASPQPGTASASGSEPAAQPPAAASPDSAAGGELPAPRRRRRPPPHVRRRGDGDAPAPDPPS